MITEENVYTLNGTALQPGQGQEGASDKPKPKNIITLPTGQEVRLKPVSMMLAQDIKQSFPEPEPTMQEAKRPDGSVRLIPVKDEDYKQAMALYNVRLDSIFLEAVLVDGLDFELTEEQTQQVQAYRVRMERRGIKLSPDDKYVYLAYVLAIHPTELAQLRDSIVGLNQPGERAMATARDAFRGQVAG